MSDAFNTKYPGASIQKSIYGNEVTLKVVVNKDLVDNDLEVSLDFSSNSTSLQMYYFGSVDEHPNAGMGIRYQNLGGLTIEEKPEKF